MNYNIVCDGPGVKVVPIDTLHPLAGNPRRGDEASITESLTAHGQYSPLIVNAETHEIIAGNTTWRVARSLGWSHIAVTYETATPDETVKRALVDNRASELAEYDDQALLDFLEGMPSLDGTGYGDDEVAELRERLNGPLDGPRSGGQGGGAPSTPPDVTVRVGPYGAQVDYERFKGWKDAILAEAGSKAAALGRVRRMLGFADLNMVPERVAAGDRAARVRARADRIEALQAAGVAGIVLSDDMAVPIDNVAPHPQNARRGDLRVVTESLLANGQFRPIIVNQRTGHIVKGNHTWQAAKALGWARVAAVFVDVDALEEDRLVAIDNRTSDLGTNDDRAVLDLIVRLGDDLDGVGYDEFDIEMLSEDIARADEAARAALTDLPPERVAVGKWVFTVSGSEFAEWLAQVGSKDDDVVVSTILERLNLSA